MAAAPPLSKAEYLKRYLSGADVGVDGGSESSRKRRKKRPKPGGAGGKGMRIVDDDVSWAAISTAKLEKEEEEDGDLPVVAEFVDERPEEVKQMEAFRSSAKWKLLGGHSEDLSSHGQFYHDDPDPSPPRRARHDTPDPSPPRRARHDTPDPSPPRRARHDTPDPSPPRRARHDTPDPSPPRRARHDTPDPSPSRRARHDTPDPSPPRRARHDTPDASPPRRARHDTPDASPPRRARHDTPDPSPPRRVRHDTPDLSPPRRGGQASDASPSRKSHRNSSGVSPRRVHHGSSGISSPRRTHNHSPDTARHRRILDSSDAQHRRRVRHNSPDSALPRTKTIKAPERSSNKTSHQKEPGPSYPPFSKTSRHEHDLDLSPRKRQAKPHVGAKKQFDSQGVCQKTSDSDLSPPWQKSNPGHQDSDSDLSPPRNRQKYQNSDSDLSPPRRSPSSRKKATHMYSRAKTGLVTDIQREQQELKKRDQDIMAFGAQFQFAETVVRDKSGRRRNLKLERLEQRRKEEERDELYAEWGKGLAQSQQQQQNVEDAMKEMQKPLARYIDDEDLDRMLREQEREGDPMANFIRKSKAKESKNKKVRPRYSGPAPPPNRFNIWPGYRWDGVDRSNGFEQKRFARLASKKAVEELAYKWSVEDM